MSTKEHIGGCDVVERFVIALVVVVGHEIGDGLLEFPGEVEGVELDDGFHRAMIPLDFALGLGMMSPSVNLRDVQRVEVVGQGLGDERRAVVRQQPRAMFDLDMLNAGEVHSELERLLDVGCAHGRSQPPGEDIARKVVQHGAQVVPAPTHHLELGEVGLPHLIHPFGRVLERRRL